MKKIIILFPTLAGIMWGATGVFTRILNAYGMNNATILETRMLIGTVILAAGCLLVNPSLLKIRRKDWWIFLGGGILGNFGLSYFYTEAINQLSMAFAAVLLCTFPVFVMLLSAVLFHEPVTGKKAGCMVLAFTGCVLVSGILESGILESGLLPGGNLPGGSVRISALGVLTGLLAAFCYALYSIFTKTARNRGYSSITITFYFMALVTLLLAPMTDWKQMGAYVAQAPVSDGIFLLAHSLCAAVLPYVIYTFAMTYMDAGKASILASSEPAAAMVFGFLLFDERPTVLMVCGMALTICAIVLLSCPEKHRKTENG